MLDVLITGATVFSGDAPPFTGDVGVAGAAIRLVTICHKDRVPPPARVVVVALGHDFDPFLELGDEVLELVEDHEQRPDPLCPAA